VAGTSSTWTLHEIVNIARQATLSAESQFELFVATTDATGTRSDNSMLTLIARMHNIRHRWQFAYSHRVFGTATDNTTST